MGPTMEGVVLGTRLAASLESLASPPRAREPTTSSCTFCGPENVTQSLKVGLKSPRLFWVGRPANKTYNVCMYNKNAFRDASKCMLSIYETYMYSLISTNCIELLALRAAEYETSLV